MSPVSPMARTRNLKGPLASAWVDDRRLRERGLLWARLLSAFFTVQTINQALALGTGLLLVRTASKETFALYAVASSVLTFFTFASDLGATGSLVHFFHRERRGEGSFAAAVAVVRELRRWAFLLGAPVAAVIFYLLAGRQGYTGWVVAACAAALVVGVALQITASIRLQILRLRDGLATSYRAEVLGNATRFAATAVAAALGWFAWISGAPAAVAAAVLGTAVTVGFASSAGRAATISPITPDVLQDTRRAVLRYLAPSLPSGLYFAIQGPLIVWLAATLGDTTQLADVGALGRLGLLLSVFSPLPGVVLLPRLVHIHDESLFWRRALQFGLLFAALLAPFVLASWLFPTPFLAILGPAYQGLGAELPLAMGGAAAGIFGGYLVGLTRARGYTRWDTQAMLAMVAAQAVFAAMLPLGTTRGILWFALLSASWGALLQILIVLIGRRRALVR